MSAIADVARLAGVSKSTASRALSGHGYVSNQTRDKVRSAAATIGYVASSNAASLVTGRTRNVGVLIPFFDRWYFAEVLRGIESALMVAGYDVTPYTLAGDETRRRRIFDYFLVRKRVDAVIAVGIAPTQDEVRMLQSLNKPIVGIGGVIAGIPTLSIDDVAGARLVTDHLIGLGHTRILHLGGDLENQMDFRVHEQRLAGFRLALSAAGIDGGEDFRVVPLSMPGGYGGAIAALADPLSRPTAIVAGCDEVAFGALVAARELGIRVPDELSVIGIDGHPFADMFQLTTLEQTPSDHGALAVDMLLSRLDGEAAAVPAEQVTMPARLRIRASTAAPALSHA